MNITIDFQMLRNMGNQMKEKATNYNNEIKAIYATTDSINQQWDGADNLAYVNKVNEYKSLMQDLGKVLDNYGTFLNETAKNMEQVQNDIKSAATKL